jgi:hypothetical protein
MNIKGSFSKIYPLLLLVAVPLIFSGCGLPAAGGPLVTEGKTAFERVVVLPFQRLVAEGMEAGVVSCPVCGMIHEAGPLPDEAEDVLESLFLEQVRQRHPRLGIIAGERVAGVYRRVSLGSFRASMRNVAHEVGNELGAEGVVVGYLYRFREREGTSYTVQRAASVGFDIHLLRVSDGALVWRGHFDRTQASLMEDLLQIASFYRGKGRWVTAGELAQEGVSQVLKSFPGIP